MYNRLALAGVLCMGILSVPLFNSSANAAPKVFEQMTGKFRGKGLVKYKPQSKKEAIRCRSNNSIQKDGSRLKLRGSCAVGGFVFSLGGHIDHRGGNKYSASIFNALSSIRRSKIVGTGSGNRINFTLSGQDTKTKKALKGRIKVTSKAKSYVIDVHRTDPDSGKSFHVGTITFKSK